MESGPRWLARAPHSVDIALAGKCKDKGMQNFMEQRQSCTFGPELPPDLRKGCSEQDTVDLVKLFMLRCALSLTRVKKLIGRSATILLLDLRAISCFDPENGHLLTPSKAVEAATESADSSSTLEMFANVALWPVGADMLIATDFNSTIPMEGNSEPVMYPADDTHTLVSGAPRDPPAACLLDVCCGSGIQGLLALKHYAQEATLLDSNPRALRFARFNAYLNGVQARCRFLQGDICSTILPETLSCSFDAILANLPFLPNPHNVVTNMGPIFTHGGETGEKVLESVLVKSVRNLLVPGGRLTVVAAIPNQEELANRVKGWFGKDQIGFRVLGLS